NGSIANGSRRNPETLFSAAPAASLATFEARKTPCDQAQASVTSGTALARRPPNRMASIGTPLGSSHSGAITGHWPAGTAKREFGCAAGNFESGIHELPCQSVSLGGGVSLKPSHHTSPSSVSATLVKTVLACS